MGSTFTVENGHIWLRTEYDFRFRAKSVSPFTWMPEHRSWRYPATPAIAAALAHAFAGTPVQQDDAFATLVQAEATQKEAAARARDSDAAGVPEIPVTRRDKPPWTHQKKAAAFVIALWGGLPDGAR